MKKIKPLIYPTLIFLALTTTWTCTVHDSPINHIISKEDSEEDVRIFAGFPFAGLNVTERNNSVSSLYLSIEFSFFTPGSGEVVVQPLSRDLICYQCSGNTCPAQRYISPIRHLIIRCNACYKEWNLGKKCLVDSVESL